MNGLRGSNRPPLHVGWFTPLRRPFISDDGHLVGHYPLLKPQFVQLPTLSKIMWQYFFNTWAAQARFWNTNLGKFGWHHLPVYIQWAPSVKNFISILFMRGDPFTNCCVGWLLDLLHINNNSVLTYQLLSLLLKF